ncbi:hypothetical protein C3941_23680 [Kaistia algarum]|uniref:hypothetical protein n=1 Tax=Kaistia algarum TaxID=2083279 RepID=UPI000CE8DD90|nr:hypothetical protein [Kaistia algarum]MCX5513440.1 hypothetical protein [Kaistia algarum]PPE77461.1 hypothetical protein C3941_23680 [Kaistia algarum]
MPAISDEWHYRIKAVTRDLVEACGGVVRAASICGASKTVVSRWQNAREAEVIPVTAAAALEADCGLTLVLAAYADLLGRRIGEPGDVSGATARCVFEQHATTIGAAAKLMATGAAAAVDGALSPSEAELMDRDAGTVEAEIAALRRNLASAKNGRRLAVVGED